MKGWGGGLDMRTMVYGYATPDQRATSIAMARFHGLPSFALAGASDAKLVDGQAAAEAALTLAVETLAGVDLVHDLGYLASGMTGSLSQLVVCAEIVGWLRHLQRRSFSTTRRWPLTSLTSSARAGSSSLSATRVGTSVSSGTRTSSSVRRGMPGRPRAAARSRWAPVPRAGARPICPRSIVAPPRTRL